MTGGRPSLLLRALVVFAVIVATAFALGVLWHHMPAHGLVRLFLVAAWLFLAIRGTAWFLQESRADSLLSYVGFFAVLLAWFVLIEPSNNRAWSPEMARTLTHTREGDEIVVTNVRNFNWTGPETADERWQTRRYRLSDLSAIDILSLYWKGDRVAHTYFSFVWANGETLSLSVEIRKEKDETYSPIAGFFKAYELSILAGDERDFYGWRVFFPKEDIQLFRTNATPEQARTLLLKLLDLANRVAKTPVFYNTLTDNCTTEVWMLTETLGHGTPNDWRLLASGYLPDFLHDIGILDTTRPLQELRDTGRIMPRVRDALDRNLTGAAFSNAIRQGVK